MRRGPWFSWTACALLALTLGSAAHGADDRSGLTRTAADRVTEAGRWIREARALLADEDPARVTGLSLVECLYLALYNNLDIAVQQLEPEAAGADVLAAEGAFDPELFFTYEYGDSTDPQSTRGALSTGQTSVTETTVTVDGGVRGKLASGAEYEVTASRKRTSGSLFIGSGISHEFEADAQGSITQPLLRNFGIAVNTADIRIARRQRAISEEEFARQVMETITATHDAYWEIVRARENLTVAIESVHVAVDLLRQNMIRLEVGTMAPLEVLQAEAGVAARIEVLIVARQAVRDTEDDLKRLMNLPDSPAAWDMGLRPKDVPDAAAPTVDVDAAVTGAMRDRPEVRAAHLELQNRDINLLVARNQTLPALGVTGEYGLQGTNEHLHAAVDQAGNPTENWRVSIDASYPVWNRDARGKYRRAQVEYQQQELRIDDLELSITSEVRQGVRAVETAWERMAVTRLATRLATEQLAAEQKKLEVGVSTSFDVLQFEEDLTEARGNEIAATIDYQQALAALDLTMGRTLATHGITIGES